MHKRQQVLDYVKWKSWDKNKNVGKSLVSKLFENCHLQVFWDVVVQKRPPQVFNKKGDL